ncbi:HAD family hydrolase [Pareuzebyella sediminis]|uniref:HAD family hydrolase n=1 Tax=Pareuzebyella sediminis TaxID=2607998 RepID=UPI0011EBA4AF|nr:HAD family hydrolase [Pareuzebyella sediminis]
MDIKVNKRTVVAFDLDDTLYNEIDFLKSAYKEIAATIDPTSWKATYALMFSLHRCGEDAFQFVADKFICEKSELLDRYRNHYPEITPFQGVIELFQSIKSKGGKICLITDGRSTTQHSKIKALGIQHFLDKIVISEEVGTEKPNTNNFHIIEEVFKKHNYTYIADNFRKDFISPNKLGWQTIGLIDNGQNIHFDSHRYMKNSLKPKEVILKISDITVI